MLDRNKRLISCINVRLIYNLARFLRTATFNKKKKRKDESLCNLLRARVSQPNPLLCVFSPDYNAESNTPQIRASTVYLAVRSNVHKQK